MLPKTFKKLAFVLATFALIIETIKEDEMVLEKIPYIYYPLCFRKNIIEAKTLLNSENEVNAMMPTYQN